MNPIQKPDSSRMERLSGVATDLTGSVPAGKRLFENSQSLELPGSTEDIKGKLPNTRQPGLAGRISQLFNRILERWGLKNRQRQSSAELSTKLQIQTQFIKEAFEIGAKIGGEKKKAAHKTFLKVAKKIRDARIPESKKRMLLRKLKTIKSNYMSRLDQSLKEIEEAPQGANKSFEVPTYKEKIEEILAELKKSK